MGTGVKASDFNVENYPEFKRIIVSMIDNMDEVYNSDDLDKAEKFAEVYNRSLA